MSEASASIRGVPKIVTGALVREGRVLLVHRSSSRAAYPDVWDLPGGHIETGESELCALSRELHEELDVHISVNSCVHLCRLIGGAGRSVLLSVWLVGQWQGTPTNVAPEEHDDIRWFAARELPPLAHEQVRILLADAIAVHQT